MHRAMEESHLHYGGQGPAKNPLEIMIDQELDEEYARRDRDAAEVLHAILSFASEGINVPGVIYKWHRITRRIKSDETLTYVKANENHLTNLLIKFSDPNSLEELRECAVEYI